MITVGGRSVDRSVDRLSARWVWVLAQSRRNWRRAALAAGSGSPFQEVDRTGGGGQESEGGGGTVFSRSDPPSQRGKWKG